MVAFIYLLSNVKPLSFYFGVKLQEP